jgi:hypothetical protein
MNRFVQLIVVQLIIAFVAAVLAGCAGADAAPVVAEAPAVATAPAAEPAPDTDPAAVVGCTGQPIPGGSPVEVTARLVDGRVEPPPSRVDVALGAPVVLRVEAGAPAEVHVHGYDAAADAAPGAPACLQFVADLPGVFEVESHPDHTVLLQLAVR